MGDFPIGVFDVLAGQALLDAYRETLPNDRRHLLDGFRYVHLARKVVGVGSVGTRAYIVDWDHVTVWCTNTHAIVDTISVGTRPSCIAMDRDRLYVADHDGGVTAYLVASVMPALYPQLTAPSPRALVVPPARELVAAGV